MCSEHQAADVKLAGALGQHELHGLPLGQRLAERRALDDALRRHVQRPLRHADVVHAMAQTTVAEAVLAHGEAVALAADQVGVRHDQVLDLDLAVAAPALVLLVGSAHDRDVADDVVARVGQLHKERAELTMALRVRVGLGHQERVVGQVRGAAEPLLAVDDPVVPVTHGRASACRRVGARRPLRHREAHPLVALDERLEELLLLVVRAVREERQNRRVVRALRVECEGAEAALAQFNLDQRVGQTG